jgi:D-alanine-D-alanine ligase
MQNNNFGKVAVLMGGHSAEREVSLKSGQAVFAALLRQQVDAHAVDVRDSAMADIAGQYDRAFIVLHGRGGEDGTMQGALETLGIPYTGSGVLGSALGMDKLRCKYLWRGLGIATPDFLLLMPGCDVSTEAANISFPVFVKPSREGSSIGMSKVDKPGDLPKAVELAWQYDQEVLVEQFIDGCELTVAILQDETLPVIRIETPNIFYDYDAKYQADSTQYHCPGGLDAALEIEIQQIAKQTYDSVAGSGWGRVDFMLDQDNKPYVLEVNTIPGMTDHSLVPMAARAAGIDFDELVLRILETSNDTSAKH